MINKKSYSIACISCVILLFTSLCWAHSPGQSSISIRLDQTSAYGEIKIFYDDLQTFLPDLPEPTQNLNFKELLKYEPQILNLFTENIYFVFDQAAKKHQFEILKMANFDQSRTVFLLFRIRFDNKIPTSINIGQKTFFNVNEQFSTFITLNTGKKIKATVLRKNRPSAELFVSSFTEFMAFLNYGLQHISLGFDHICFILLLVFSPFLLPPKTASPQKFSTILWSMIKLATAFTIAHSLTLIVAVLDLYYIHSTVIEVCILASIIFVGLHNIFHFDISREWFLVFMFGLFHGYGFSSALKSIGLFRGNLAIPLGGFNIGVELGQIIIILLTLFPIYFLSTKWKGTIQLLRFANIIIILLGVLWLVRMFINI